MQPEASESSRPAANPFRGLLTIFFSPSETFAAAPRKRPWLVPLVAACLLALITNVMVVNVIGMETIMRNQLEARPELAERLGQDAIDKMVHEAGSSPARKWMSYVTAPIVTAIILCVIAALMLGALLITGADTKFASLLAACAWGWYVMLAVTAVATGIFLVSVRDFSGVDVSNLFALNPTLFVERSSTSPFVYSVLSSLDLLSFWAMFVIALGVSKLSAGVSFAKALTVIIALWAVFVLCKAGFASLF